MSLLEEIKTKCSAELLASQDADAIAAVVNVGRTAQAVTCEAFLSEISSASTTEN